MKCTKCKLEGAYIRIKSNEVVCKMCGHIEPYESAQEKKDEAKPKQ